MAILYDEQQSAIADETRRVLAARADKQRLLELLERTGAFDRMFWETAVAQGWTGLAIPEGRGGLGLGLVELGIVAQAAGALPAGAPFLATGDAVAQALLAPSASAIAEPWLPQLARGDAIGALAFAAGGAPLPERPAVQFANGKLSGIKPAVTAGLHADVALVWAQQDGQCVLAFAPLAGVERRAVASYDNSRGYADLVFAATPATVLARGVAAVRLGGMILARLAVVLAHEQLGGAEALLFVARDYANTRKAFGQPIGAFQAVKHRIAELYGLVEIARANCLHAAAREGCSDFVTAAAAARLSATEAYDTAARDCVQIHGAIGVTWEQALHLHMRRARSLAIEAGNALFWEDLLVEQLTGIAA